MKTGKLILDLADTIQKEKTKSLTSRLNFKKPMETGNQDCNRLEEFLLKNITYFGAIHYETYLDMKLNYTFSLICQ